ncbi:MAG: Hsp20 family protein [Blastocatellia bacterium]|nr:Hsp20 family protein [Blastocatellia bacterium]MCS7158534.1 Hsp20 family protein [Blastocatellia bacterium]MDW8169341.1 Hsp20 family protein [Acidobacteriota bacterium]MDW8257730.1 Hsp20 family protein [Acidobacteriota bacterium]
MAVIRVHPYSSPIREEADRIRARIAERAYELAARRGYAPGHELEDWLTAESQLVWKPELRLEEHPQEFVLKFRLPGVRATDVRVVTEAERVLLLGEARVEGTTEGVRVHGDEFRYGPIFREVWLPQPVDSTRAKARLSDGVLTVTLPKPKAERSLPRPKRSRRERTT